MTKPEAIKALIEGKKLTHSYFSRDEYVFLKDGKYCFEDGVTMPQWEFWSLRNSTGFDNDWEIYVEPKK